MKHVGRLVLLTLDLGVVAVVLSSLPHHRAAAASGPFANTCLNGRYLAAGSGVDVFFGNPFAVAGYVDLTCTKQGAAGTYTGMLTITYPTSNNSLTVSGATVAPSTCTLTNGQYTIDPSTGAITASALLGGGSCNFSSVTYTQTGYISDQLAHQIYVVDTTVIEGEETNILPLIFTKSP